MARLDLFRLLTTARKDMLGAMGLLPSGVALSKAPFGIPFVVAQKFSTAQQVLVSDVDSYRKPWMIRHVIEDGLGENLFTLEGPAWLTRRQICAPVFGVHELGGLTTTMHQSIATTVTEWKPGEIDIQAAMTTLTMRVALRSLLGTDHDTTELSAKVHRAFDEILDWITFRFNRPVSAPAFMPTARNRRLKESKVNLRRAIIGLIEHRRTHDSGEVDVLSQLVRAQQSGTHELTDDEILEECIGFMFAGHETTASTLTWALYELSLRPALQDAIADEFAAPSPTTESLGKDLAGMSQTNNVIEETLRLYPSGISVVRSARRTTEIDGERIRRGTFVMIPVYAIQRDESVWDRPNDFDPTRYIAGNGDGFLPFSIGPRRCLGARFARTELRIALGLICSNWRLNYKQPEPPTPIVAPSLRAEGQLLLQISPRTT